MNIKELVQKYEIAKNSLSVEELTKFEETKIVLTEKLHPLYGIKNIKKDKIMMFDISSNEGCHYCNETSTRLTDNGTAIWAVPNPKTAKWVLHNSTSWYNSCHKTPSHDIKELCHYKVVNIFTNEEIEVEIPTRLAWLEYRFKGTKYKKYIDEYLQECNKNNINTETDYNYMDVYFAEG